MYKKGWDDLKDEFEGQIKTFQKGIVKDDEYLIQSCFQNIESIFKNNSKLFELLGENYDEIFRKSLRRNTFVDSINKIITIINKKI